MYPSKSFLYKCLVVTLWVDLYMYKLLAMPLKVPLFKVLFLTRTSPIPYVHQLANACTYNLNSALTGASAGKA